MRRRASPSLNELAPFAGCGAFAPVVAMAWLLSLPAAFWPALPPPGFVPVVLVPSVRSVARPTAMPGALSGMPFGAEAAGAAGSAPAVAGLVPVLAVPGGVPLIAGPTAVSGGLLGAGAAVVA